MKTAVSLARLPTHRARQSGFHAQAHDSALPREPSGGYEDLNVKGCGRTNDLPRRSRMCFGIFRPLMCRYVALSYFNIGAASIYAVKFLTEPVLGGKPR